MSRWLLAWWLITLAACGQAGSQSAGQGPATSESGGRFTTPSGSDVATLSVGVQVATLPVGGQVTTVAELDAATGGLTIDRQRNLYAADIGPAPSRLGTRVLLVSPRETSVLLDDAIIRGASGNTVHPDGDLYQAALSAGRVVRITTGGKTETFSEERLKGPVGVVFGPSGALFVADCSANVIWQVDTGGAASLYAQSPLFACPNGIAASEDGALFVANFGDGKVLRIDRSGRVTVLADVPGGNNGHLAYARGGVVLVAARAAHQIYAVNAMGEMALLAGTGEPGLDDGPSLEASFSLPNGVAMAAEGAVYVSHSGSARQNHPTVIRRIELSY